MLGWEDGQGNYIRVWNEDALGPQPTDQEWEAWELPAVKEAKEQELRDGATLEYEATIRSFEGTVISSKFAKGTQLSPWEQEVMTAMQQNYARLRTLVQQSKNATTVEEVEAIVWESLSVAPSEGSEEAKRGRRSGAGTGGTEGERGGLR